MTQTYYPVFVINRSIHNLYTLDVIFIFENLWFFSCLTTSEEKQLSQGLNVAVVGIKMSKILVSCDGLRSLVNVV